MDLLDRTFIPRRSGLRTPINKSHKDMDEKLRPSGSYTGRHVVTSKPSVRESGIHRSQVTVAIQRKYPSLEQPEKATN